MSLYATPNDLLTAVTHISSLLSIYQCEQEGFYEGYGIPHAFCGGWEVAVLGGIGSEEIICITTATNRQLRKALAPNQTSLSTSPTTQSPFESTVFSLSSINDDDGDSTLPRLELHAHPKSGVPMTVVVHPPMGMSESGKSIRIDMLQAGEYGPRHLHKSTNPPVLISLFDLPFLSPTEWIRAKVKRLVEMDMDDVAWMLCNHVYELNPNRLPLEEMEDFVQLHNGNQVIETWENYKAYWRI